MNCTPIVRHSLTIGGWRWYTKLDTKLREKGDSVYEA